MADATAAMKKAMWHASIAQQWNTGLFGWGGDAKIAHFHRQASALYSFRAARGLPCDDLDENVGLCMKHKTYNLRVGKHEGTAVIPIEGGAVFSVGSSRTCDWRVM